MRTSQERRESTRRGWSGPEPTDPERSSPDRSGTAWTGPERRRGWLPRSAFTWRLRWVGQSLARRLRATSAAYLVLLVLVGSVGIASAAAVGATRDEELRLAGLERANAAMLLSMTNAETGVRGYRLTGDREFLEPYDEGRASFPEAMARARAQAVSPDEQRLVERQGAIARQWFADWADPIAASPATDEPVPLADALTQKRTFDAYRAQNQQLATLADQRGRAAVVDAQESQARILTLTALALAGALVAAWVVHARLHRSLVGPLGEVVTVLGRLSAGEHDARADTAAGPTEVRLVASSLNALAAESDRLRTVQAAAEEQQQVAVEISRAVRDRIGTGDPVDEALRRLGEQLGVDRVYVRQIQADDRTEMERQWMRPPLAPLPSATGDAEYDREAAERSRAIYAAMSRWVSHDTSVVPEGENLMPAFVARTGARAAVAVPVGAGPETLGLLAVLQTTAPRRWREHEIALIASVAADLGRALVVSRLLAQQEALVERLQEVDRAKTDFLSTVSHELRTPLTSIAGYLEMVREGDGGDVPPAMDAMLVIVERNAARLRSLIEDLLTLSRIESGAYRVTYEEVALAEIAAVVVQSLRPAAEKGKVTVALEVTQPDALVMADPGQLERAVTNLVSNAVKFTPAGGWVRVATRVVEGSVVLEVADTGIGIPAEEQAQLFSRFFRASNAHEMAIPGTGLGLTIVRSIVEHHAGELRLASRPGEGTTVTVDLPLRAGSRSAAATLAARAAHRASVESLAQHELAVRAPSTIGAR